MPSDLLGGLMTTWEKRFRGKNNSVRPSRMLCAGCKSMILAKNGHIERGLCLKRSSLQETALRAKRTFLKNSCTQTKDPYGIPYEAIVKNNLPPSDLFKIMDQPEEGDSQSFANRILEELYPQIPIPFQSQPQNLTAREEAFTDNEIACIMKKVLIKKASWYDGINFIVLKTIFRTHP
ncbi:hypothetical protein AVEN_152959-1 [Araneus ventricosus]|uniref:Uncharacterized protein n=1 Tax=Araneus ventricosus TaxID=182803 RepID=A0A4Y2AEU3_ARAVE|nr:hypothetical protein AVEN_152959-1 [Araneus ventricosus]